MSNYDTFFDNIVCPVCYQTLPYVCCIIGESTNSEESECLSSEKMEELELVGDAFPSEDLAVRPLTIEELAFINNTTVNNLLSSDGLVLTRHMPVNNYNHDDMNDDFGPSL